MNKLKYIIAIIRLRIRQSRCYDANKRCGIAVFGMCRGHYHEDNIPAKGCVRCPYFINVKEGAEG